jgi:multidrug efflux system membrane fusion protein
VLPGVKAGMAKGAMPVAVAAPGDASGSLKGKLEFLDNTVDAATGMIRLKASLPNDGERLTPGQSVNVTLTLSTLAEAVTVPSSAVLTGPKGAYVYVVKEDMTVERRPIAAGIARDGVTVVEKGVSAGEKVVTEGQLRLVPGAKVRLPS